MMKVRKRWYVQAVDLLWRLFRLGIYLVILWIIGEVFLFSRYKIPSESMEPTLLSGDYIIVNKMSMGARLFDITTSVGREPSGFHRVWGYSKLKQGDIVVFNDPYPRTRDSIEFDIRKYFVKRCWGVAGDSLTIEEGYYKNNGQLLTNISHEVKNKQDSLHYVFYEGERKVRGLSIKAFPKRTFLGWTIINYGPLYIPRKDDILLLNKKHFLIYKNLIEWETRKKLVWHNEAAYLDGVVLTSYRFEKSYYFVGGDNVFNSVDSRYWGLVPEDFIAGKVAFIWNSINPMNNKVRWNRLGRVR